MHREVLNKYFLHLSLFSLFHKQYIHLRMYYFSALNLRPTKMHACQKLSVYVCFSVPIHPPNPGTYSCPSLLYPYFQQSDTVLGVYQTLIQTFFSSHKSPYPLTSIRYHTSMFIYNCVDNTPLSGHLRLHITILFLLSCLMLGKQTGDCLFLYP